MRGEARAHPISAGSPHRGEYTPPAVTRLSRATESAFWVVPSVVAIEAGALVPVLQRNGGRVSVAGGDDPIGGVRVPDDVALTGRRRPSRPGRLVAGAELGEG
jgi:hypothetical protein